MYQRFVTLQQGVKSFFQSVRNYFMIACDYIIKKLPVNDPLLQHAEVADIKLRTSQKFSY
jgi:hypothetical protein